MKGGKCAMMQNGGGSATSYGAYVYGDAAHQAANPATGGIVMNNPMGYHSGGRKRKGKRGGSMGLDLAVPAVLLLAQQNVTKSRSSSRSSRRSRRSRRSTRRSRR
jgi:hypothetical protein